MWPNPQKTADLVTFTEKILNGKLQCFSLMSCNSFEKNIAFATAKILFLEVFLWINFYNCKRIFAFFSFLDKDSHSWDLHFVGFILLPWSLVPKNIYMVFRTKTMAVVLHSQVISIPIFMVCLLLPFRHCNFKVFICSSGYLILIWNCFFLFVCLQFFSPRVSCTYFIQM